MVTVRNGVVHLHGIATSDPARESTIVAAENTAGVKKVCDPPCFVDTYRPLRRISQGREGCELKYQQLRMIVWPALSGSPRGPSRDQTRRLVAAARPAVRPSAQRAPALRAPRHGPGTLPRIPRPRVAMPAAPAGPRARKIR
nr:BON domain-containing protein [Bradyrhizobium elkanii]